MLKASPTNTLVAHPSYQKIMHLYNEELQHEGKVNNKKFYETVILKEMPEYHLQSWYQFLKRFKTDHGIIPATITGPSGLGTLSTPSAANDVARTMLSNQEATAKLVAGLLNISADAAADILADPTKLSPKDRLELGIKIMKAQDSRIHAVGKLREDNREQEKFDRAFDSAAFV